MVEVDASQAVPPPDPADTGIGEADAEVPVDPSVGQVLVEAAHPEKIATPAGGVTSNKAVPSRGDGIEQKALPTG
jgi:hypothetical protein